MMRRRSGFFSHVLLTLAVAFAAFADQPVRFVTSAAYGTHMPGLGAPALRLSRTVNELSDGALLLDIKQPGDGVAPHEILDAVSSGQIQAGFATAALWAGKLPASPLFSGFPFGPDATGYLAWYDDGNGRKLYQELYEHAGFNVHVLPCGFAGAETAGWFKKEIGSVEDFKGLRMRIFGLGGQVVQRLGASPQLVQGGKVLDAFREGELDAAELYPPAADARYDLQAEVERIYEPGWHQPETVLELIVNRDLWDALGSRRQTWLESACKSILGETMAEAAESYQKHLQAFASQGAEIAALPDEVLKDLRAAWRDVAAEQSNRDAFFKEVLDDLEAFRANKGTARPVPAEAP
jgi:TRAP-type mannitol/chloroaromatic compound transport system substrate-binding protein